MKTQSAAMAAYERPQCEVMEICSQELICVSPEQSTGLGGFGGWEE